MGEAQAGIDWAKFAFCVCVCVIWRMLLFLSGFRLDYGAVICLSCSDLVTEWPYQMVLCEAVYVQQENIKT